MMRSEMFDITSNWERKRSAIAITIAIGVWMVTALMCRSQRGQEKKRYCICGLKADQLDGPFPEIWETYRIVNLAIAGHSILTCP